MSNDKRSLESGKRVTADDGLFRGGKLIARTSGRINAPILNLSKSSSVKTRANGEVFTTEYSITF